MNTLSLFSGAGIGETYLGDIGIHVAVANELLKKRAELYKSLHPDTEVICGDITDQEVFDKILSSIPPDIDFILASPPCQGMSISGKNRCNKTMKADERNYLITYAVNMIKLIRPRFALIENVPLLLTVKLSYCGSEKTVLELLKSELGDEYEIDGRVVDSSDYGVPQTRLRAIIKLYKRGFSWDWPPPEKKISVREAIGYLPSLESSEVSDIKWHYARAHTPQNVLWMKHTPTGKSAFSNPEQFPQKPGGERIKGYESSYRRIKWDEPAPTITIRNDCIASQRNVHPGRQLPDGTFSDARVLTPLELFILTSLPKNWSPPDDTPEILLRQCIGESIPPLMLKKIIGALNYDKT